MTAADSAMVKNFVSEFLDREFDKVGRLGDGSISDAAVDRCGFSWAVGVLCQSFGYAKPKAQELVKAVGWF